ncbi:MAG: GNAT family N-acetyltransferase [Anaerovoracaceae bacterium]
MIRKSGGRDIDDVMRIWLEGNLGAHGFIPREYWTGNFDAVKKAIREAEVYVHESGETGCVDGFIGLSGNYVEGIFVDEHARSHGVGKSLIDFVKGIKPSLELSVYEKNERALSFYAREDFKVASEETDDATGEKCLIMEWEKEETAGDGPGKCEDDMDDMTDQETGFSIRKSTLHDLPRMLEIYAFARKFMAEHRNPRQWGTTGWPPEKLLRADIASGCSYVCEADGRIVGTFYYNYGLHIEKTYEKIFDGEWLGVRELGEAGNTYGVVHRIAGDGSVRGTGSFCIGWAMEQCGHLRIDTHFDNKVMQNLLTKLGFERCGVIYVEEDDDPRYAYEKISR